MKKPKILSNREKLVDEYPLLDFSFGDDYREEVGIMLQAQNDYCYKEMLRQFVGELGKLNVNWRVTRKAGWMMQADLDQFIEELRKSNG